MAESIRNFAYAGDPNGSGFNPQANAWQKYYLVKNLLGGIVQSFRGHERDRVVWCFPVHGMPSIVGVLKARFIYRVKYFMFTWDPPGMSVWNRQDWKSRIRRWLQMWLYARGVAGSLGLVLNLHPGFMEKHLPRRLMGKVHSFPNGHVVGEDYNAPVHGKYWIAVSAAITRDKGCYEVAQVFVKLWQANHEWRLVWCGDGSERAEVEQFLKDQGVASTAVEFTGNVSPDEARKRFSECSIGLNMYRDVPSLRWNYVLKVPEFLALGLKVVSVDTPGVREYLNDNMILFKDGNHDEAVAALQRIAEMEIEPVDLKEYSWKTINDQIAKYITEKCNSISR